MQELLDEIDVIEVFEHTGSTLRISEVTKKQIDFYKTLGVTPPNTL